MEIAIPILCFLSLLGLMLSMPQHQRSWLGSARPALSNRPFRWSGFLLAALALAVSITASGWGEGITAWFGWESAATALIVGANALRDSNKGSHRK